MSTSISRNNEIARFGHPCAVTLTPKQRQARRRDALAHPAVIRRSLEASPRLAPTLTTGAKSTYLTSHARPTIPFFFQMLFRDTLAPILGSVLCSILTDRRKRLAEACQLIEPLVIQFFVSFIQFFVSYE